MRDSLFSVSLFSWSPRHGPPPPKPNSDMEVLKYQEKRAIKNFLCICTSRSTENEAESHPDIPQMVLLCPSEISSVLFFPTFFGTRHQTQKVFSAANIQILWVHQVITSKGQK